TIHVTKSGLTSVDSGTLTVTDTSPPTIVAPADLTDVPTDPGVCSRAKANVNLGTPTTADNCGVASVGNDAPVTFPKGTTKVTWTVTDTSGNTATATQQITIRDHEKPVITLLGSSPVTVECHSTYTDVGASASDNCDGNLTSQIVTVNPVNQN